MHTINQQPPAAPDPAPEQYEMKREKKRRIIVEEDKSMKNEEGKIQAFARPFGKAARLNEELRDAEGVEIKSLRSAKAKQYYLGGRQY